jgi:glycerol-3-phosphate O-acyltransferase
VLSGLDAPEFFDTRLFVSLVENLEAEGLLWREEGRLHFDRRLTEGARHSHALFDPALRHRLQLITRRGGQA